MNSFAKNAIKATNVSVTENGALSYKTMGTALLDQFGKAGTARGRDIDVVWKEQEALWAENPEMALRLPFYLRMITRKSYGFDDYQTEKIQRGQGGQRKPMNMPRNSPVWRDGHMRITEDSNLRARRMNSSSIFARDYTRR